MKTKHKLQFILSFSILFVLVSLPEIFFPLAAQRNPEKTVKRYKPELTIPSGYPDSVVSIAYSPDGTIMAGGGWSTGSLILWDAKNGRQLRTLRTDSRYLNSVAFSPDGTKLAAGGQEALIVWNLVSGEKRVLASGPETTVFDVAFSPDGKTLASSRCPGCPGRKNRAAFIDLWKLDTGSRINSLRSNAEIGRAIAISPDGDLLALGGKNEIIELRSMSTGKIIRTLAGHKKGVASLDFVNGGERLISSGWNDSIKSWDVESGRELNKITGKIESFGKLLAIDAEKNLLAFVHSNDSIHFINLDDFQLVKKTKTTKGLSRAVRSIALGPTSSEIALGIIRGIVLLDAGGTLKRRLGERVFRIWGVNKSTDGKTLAAPSWDSTIKLWNIETGNELSLLKGHSSPVITASYSPDRKLLASGSGNGNIKLWDTETKREIRTINGHKGRVNSLSFSSDGSFLLSTSNDQTIKLWNVKTGEMIRSFLGHSFQVLSASFSPDEKLIASGSGDKTLRIWDIKSGREIKRIESFKGYVKPVVFSPNGALIAANGYERKTRFWRLNDFKEISLPKTPDWANIDGRTDIVTLNPKTVAINMDSGIRLLDKETDRELATIMFVGDSDWAIVTPEGLFDASEGAMKMMYFTVLGLSTGHEIIEFNQLKSRFYVPGLHTKILNREKLGTVGNFTLTLTPKIELAQKANDPNSLRVKLTNRGGGIGRVELKINGREINGDIRGRSFDPNASESRINIPIPKDRLREGENTIGVIAWNSEGDVRSEETNIKVFGGSTVSKSEPSFYAIIGGISDYPGTKMDLRFAAKDSEDFAVSMALGAKSLLCSKEIAANQPCEKVHISLLSSEKKEKEHPVFDDLPNFRRLSPSKENFQTAFERVSENAKSEDLFVAYFAGHGTAIKSAAAREKSAFADMYLYPTSDSVTLDSRRLQNESERASMISSLELADWFNKIRAEKEALIIDTCAAGAVQKDLNTQIIRGDDGEQIRALDRLRERTGFYVLMGSAANAVSYEANKFRQGLLTYSLLEAMSGAKLRNERFIDIEDLFGYAEDRVEELAKGINGIQRPRYFKSKFSKRFDIGRLEPAERKRIPLTKAVPIILLPKLIDKNSLFDSLDLSGSLESKLRELSYLGRRSGTKYDDINFVPVNSISGGFSPSGLYSVGGETVTVELTIRQGDKEFSRIKVTGTKDRIADKLLAAIISEVVTK